MKQNTKIKSFTLSEIIVVLILTSVVVAMAFTVLSLVQRHMFSIQANLQEHTEINKLETALSLDFNRYNSIRYNSDDNELEFTNPLNTIYYKFYQDYLVKQTDTFKLKISLKSFYFTGDEKSNGDIDALKFTINEGEISKQIFIFKTNDATTFMK